MSIKNILNHIAISERIGTSGQPSPIQFQDIADAGFTSVINLAMPDSDNALPDEGGFVSELGMKYFHMPVPFDAPAREHLELFLNLMKVLEDEKVWVHCALNMRVSAFMKHYQISEMKLAENDCVPMLANWEPDVIWKELIDLKL